MGTARIDTIMDFARLDVDVAGVAAAAGGSATSRLDRLGAIFGAAALVPSAERLLPCFRRASWNAGHAAAYRAIQPSNHSIEQGERRRCWEHRLGDDGGKWPLLGAQLSVA